MESLDSSALTLSAQGPEENKNRGEELKGVGLYKAVRVFNDLRHLAKEQQHKAGHQQLDDDNAALLPLEQVWAYDQLHYEGTRALDRAIDKVGVKPGQQVLDVGAGLGGPARYLAHKAVELQGDMCEAAAKITSLTELRDSDLVRFVHGDFLHMSEESVKKLTTNEEGFDCVISILTVLHIEAKANLFARCYRLLKPGGALWLEDYYAAGTRDLSHDTERALEKEVGCAMPIPSRDQYLQLLNQAGFIDIQFEDLTPNWWQFVRDRASEYHANIERHRKVQGDREQVDSLDAFYQTVAGLFNPLHKTGLGGAVICCRRPLDPAP